MRRLRDLPIGQKLVAVGILASALALAVSSVIFLTSTLVSLRRGVVMQMRVQSSMIGDNVAGALAFLDPETASEVLSALHATDEIDYACLYGGSGELFASYFNGPGTCPAAAPPDQETVGDRQILISQGIVYKGRRQGTLLLSGNFGQVQARLANQGVAAITAIILGVIAAVVLSTRIQRVIARPIRDLAATAAAISRGGDYSLRATKHGNDEIGQLVSTFNTMVAEVERREEQLRGANRVKDEFLAALSHELRTPLNAVLGWIQVLRTTPPDPAVTVRAYESIERNARAQVTLIEDLLDISRIITGKLHFKTETVELGPIVEAALEVVRPAAAAKGITIERHLDAAPVTVTGDPHRLQQIAWNLLSNAVKFTPRGGRVVVTLRGEIDQIVLEVSDNGIGIPPEFLPHVFDRFRQADGSLSRRHGGLGLGLAIAHELTELHGGQIRAESEGEGRGATFVVALPRRAPASEPSAVDAPAVAMRLDSLRVLVVDDDDEARTLAATVVTSMGGAVESLATAEEALTRLGQVKFDVLLCDLAMPGTDGFELIRRLRQIEQHTSRPTPAVAVSAHVGQGAEARAKAAGFQAFVAKPYDLETLVAAIATATAP
jgi:signal transduction histidine kinase/ActR/RegA family two-component response regulator